MSVDNVLIDGQAVRDRNDVFKRTFPTKADDHLYEFTESASIEENLRNLCDAALNDRYSFKYLFVYKPIILEVVSRWIESSDDKQKIVLVFDAVARYLAVYPVILPLVEELLDRENEYLLSIIQNTATQDTEQLRMILLAYYRVLFHDKDTFTRFIKPDALYNIVQKVPSEVPRFIAVKILSLYLDSGEASLYGMIENYISSPEYIVGIYELENEVNYKYLELNESKLTSSFTALPEVPEGLTTCSDRDSFVVEPQSLSKNIVSICGILVPKVQKQASKIKSPLEVVPTNECVAALRDLALGLQACKPMMLVGSAGSGKTFLINELSKYMECQDSVVKIHLGEQTDAKLLIGTYTSGEKPGTFEWRSGVLTTAVREGRWVLIEDVDKAPTEVLSILLTLLEKRELSIPSRGEIVKAANGFQLISTVRLEERAQRKKKDYGNSLNILGMRMWRITELEEPNEMDLFEILNKKYFILKNLVSQLIRCYKSVKAIYMDSGFTSLNRGAHSRIISTRDLIKLCARLQALFTKNQILKPDQLIVSHLYDDIFSETADCFSGAISESKALEPLVGCIGETLEISKSRIELYLTKHVPKFINNDKTIEIGRVKLEKATVALQKRSVNTTSFAATNHSLRLMEQISVAIEMSEPILLVGETGTGKTTVVQQLGKILNRPLTVINVSQQTETGDLLGGYKPVNSKTIALPIQETFESLFISTFSLKKNERFYKMLHRCFNRGQWRNVLKLWKEAYKMAENILKPINSSDDSERKESKKKRRKLDSHEQKALLDKWIEFKDMTEKFEAQSDSIDTSFVFNFVEGSLVKAVRNGEWLLLDEINLASGDTLESISDLLNEVNARSILLSEKGDANPVKAHPDFRIFACMNPATDVGKKDLPSGIRSRFTEIYVHSPDRDISDLLMIIDKYMRKYTAGDEWIGNDIAELYLEAKKLAESNLIVDGSNQKPHFSIRTLTRTLLYVCDIVHIYGLRRSLYDGFCMSFLNLLSKDSESILEPIIRKFTIARLKNVNSVISQAPPCPGPDFVQFKHYWMRKGDNEVKEQPHYIITPFVERNVLNLVRAASSRRFPVLIQGPTSAGKTSMIKYLADLTGHEFVRINNHEHTDLQEYLGTYVADDTGKLFFKEGVLVEALRKGHWIVLDELNLAPTDVLEALNRLLDDNRELFIPETQEVVHPHHDFMLFATQNPPGIYGGRKMLSRAFRNRFLELHFDDIPQDELEIILRERCRIAPSYAKKIVESYRQLSIERSATRLFEQKNSFATLRDLFRWAFRDAVGYEELAANGYMLLAERCRTSQERDVVKSVLERVMRVTLDMEKYYEELEDETLMSSESSVVWTKTMKRLLALVSSCLKNNEPVLLVGETGCGKTTICQLLASSLKKQLITLNAHQNTETGDILGAQRPVRNRSQLQKELFTNLCDALKLDVQDSQRKSIDELLKEYDATAAAHSEESRVSTIKELRENLNILFEWTDGPLVKALKEGDFFLFDEISLADDSVLERLNSVLEPERSLLLAEKGSTENFVTATDGFEFFATMNPGGDYGKKELSPALRNRFTEIWVPSMENFNDVHMIVSYRLIKPLQPFSGAIVAFSEWYARKFGGGSTTNGVISLRDILAWVEFMNSAFPNVNDANALLFHGASMVFIDALGTNNTAYLAENETNLSSLRKECIDELSKLAKCELDVHIKSISQVNVSLEFVEVGLFKVPKACQTVIQPAFNWSTPTTSMNLMRVARALQLNKPILLEGSPGVGKTSLVTALAEATGHKLTRINLSEQTDLIDLFGSDVPGEKTGEFVWRDAPFLRAMQRGEWVLLDEMNLASQSVLEGLNACLDHRGETYIPELDKTFVRHPNFVVFAAQNPQYQGGGRKGLPKSFVNRFSVVYVSMLSAADLQLIVTKSFPNVDQHVSSKIIQLMSSLDDQVCKRRVWGSMGSPWEFNLRDTLRWVKLLSRNSELGSCKASDFLDSIVKQRFRSETDRRHAAGIIEEIFGKCGDRDSLFKIEKDYIQVNGELIGRNPLYSYPTGTNLFLLECNIPIYETALRCINNNWPLLLVGPSNSGKTEIIRFLASIVGAKVSMFSMNSEVDTMDILGGYEQVDIVRKISYITHDLRLYLRKTLLANIGFDTPNENAIISGLDLLNYISNTTVGRENFYDFIEKFESFLKHFESSMALNDITERLKTLNEIIDQDVTVKFEWFDGILVKALEEGHWLILDNANLSPASVLDRLNSLLETDGSLVMNECNQEDGQPRVLRPHRDFRLFLTVNPKYGELSRAMRNRAIEVYVEDLKDRASKFDSLCLGYHPDIKLNLNKLPDMEKEMESLHLTKRGIKFPLRRYLPANFSSFKAFGDIYDIIALSPKIPVPETLLGSFTLKKLEEVVSWSTSLRSDTSQIESMVHALYAFLMKFNIPERMSSLAPSIMREELQVPGNTILDRNESFLIPVLNPYIIASMNQTASFMSSAESIYLFSCMRMISQGMLKLETIEKRALGGKINELTYIELSAAVKMGRNIKQPPKIPIFPFLEGMLKNLLHSITVSDLFNESNKYELFTELLVIWEAALETSSSKDEARLRAYKDLFEDWYNSASEKGLQIQSFSDSHFAFDSAVTLVRGRSISLLWNTYRVEYPSNPENWLFWAELSSLSKKFDNIVLLQFSESYDEVKVLREFIVTLFCDILNNNVNDFRKLISRLEVGVENLKTISDKFLVKRKHFFVEEFDSLMRFWFNGNEECLQAVTDLSPMCTISTKHILKLQNQRYCYPPIFDLLWTKRENDVECFTGSLVSPSFIECVILKAKRLHTFPGSHIHQTITDAKLLLESTLKFPAKVLNNQVELLARKLRDWILNVIQIHVKSEIGTLINTDIGDIVVKEATDSFYSVFNEYLLPALTFCNNSTSEDAVGRGYILFGVGLVVLYAPDSPYDPAIHDYVTYDCFLKHKQFSEDLKDSFAVLRTVRSGDTPIYAEKLLHSTSQPRAPSKPKVYRPASSIDSLLDEWTAFVNSTASPDHLKDMVNSLENWTETSKNRISMFQRNSTHFLERISDGFQYYADLNDIFAGYIYSMKLGFDLIMFKRSKEMATMASSSLWPVNPLLIVNETQLLEVFKDMNKIFRNSTVDNFSIEKILVFFLKLFKFQKKPEKMLPVFNDTLQTLYYRYSLRRLQVQSKQQEESKSFKYKDVDDDYEADFAYMFPDYENVLTLENTEFQKTDEDIDQVNYMVAKAYMEVFTENRESSISQMLNEGSEVLKLLVEHKNVFKSDILDAKYLSAAVSILAREIEAFEGPVDSEEIDFYKGCSIQESRQAVRVVEALCHFVADLLSQWPEHATLNELFRICQEFLQYSAMTPIAKQLQKIEQIYTFMADWEKYASSQVSLKVHIKNVTDLIICWRKLELKTWNSLLKTEDENQISKVGQWWYHLFETIIVSNSTDGGAPPIGVQNTPLLSSLNIFLGKCSFGEFGVRLDILRAFSEHLSFSKWSNKEVLKAVQNIISYYDQFKPSIDRYIAEGRNVIEKNISEVILLASWKDVNVDALKQSSRRSHGSLYKHVRKYRYLLSENVSSIIENGISSSEKVRVLTLFQRAPEFYELDLSSAKLTVPEIPNWSSWPETLKNIDTVESKMKSTVRKLSERESPNFADFARGLSEQAEELSRLTPKIFKKKDKNLASLKMQKSKVLNDSLKELKRMGLKTNFRQDIHKVQLSSTSILSHMASFNNTPLMGCDAYFLRVIDILPRLRNAALSPSEDVPLNSVERGMAIMENLVFSLITTRDPMQKLASNYLKVNEFRIELENITQFEGDIQYPSLHASSGYVENCCKWLPALLDYAISIIDIICDEKQKTEEIFFLEHVKVQINEFSRLITDNSIWNPALKTTCLDFERFLHNLVDQLRKRKEKSALFVYDIILTWIHNQAAVSEKNCDEPALENFENIFRKVFTSILLSFQHLMVDDFESITEQDDKWLSIISKDLMNSIKFLRSTTVLRHIEAAISFLIQNSFMARTSTLVRSLITFTLPVIRQYLAAMHAILIKSKMFYESLAHGSYILSLILHNLAKDGFCSPAPPSEEVDDKNLHEGTGLGDGEGAQSNSKDIEQDEDLTEDAQKPNEQQNEEEEDSGEDDAIEMEGDIAGQLGNASDQEESASDENEEDEEDMDEEIDNIDDDDPNAIDDKMWDSKPDEDVKEKETDKTLENENNDTDVQAAENEDGAENGDNPDQKEEAADDGSEKENNQEQNNDDVSDENAETEEDVGEQEDEVRDDEAGDLAADVPDVETMDLPDDMNLDSGNENDDEQEMSEVDELDNKSNKSDEEEVEEEGIQDGDTEEQVEPENDVYNDEEEQGLGAEDNEDFKENEAEESEEDSSNVNQDNEEACPSDEDDLMEMEIKEEEANAEEGQDQTEGVDGIDASLEDDNTDHDAAVQQQSGNKGKGSDAKDSEEQQDIGSSGDSANDHHNQEESEKDVETSRDNAKEALKQLGDSLKEYHKRRQDINEASQKEGEESTEQAADQRPDEFEHIDGENTESNTQALGTANQDQIQSIDEQNAIVDDVENDEVPDDDDDIDMIKDEAISDDEELEEVRSGKENNNEELEGKKKAGAFIGEMKETIDQTSAYNKNSLLNSNDDELDELMQIADFETQEDHDNAKPSRSLEESRSLWHESELATAELSARLSEQLRLILEPTLATKLKGDYKTGKRLNMKRIIPYIASQFRKDKIWLRRTKPSKRQYQIMIALDDSKSMSESKCVKLAFESLCLVSKTLTQLEAGGLSIVKFGERIREVHKFEEQFSNETGAKSFQWFGFQETKTDIKMLVAESIKIFERARALNSGDQWQLEIVISDGVCEDHETIQRLVRRARENKIMLVFVIIDGINSNESIMDMSQVEYVPDESGNLQLRINKYLDTFPFEFYVVVRDITELPEMLSVILRQFFSDLASL